MDGRRKILFGSSNSRRLYCGCKFTMSQFYQTSENIEYTLISTNFSISMAEAMSTGGGEMRDTFDCSFQAIPGTTPFRLERQTPRPMIRGPQTAKVVGQSGDEITTDQYGRIKVKFFWDRSSAQDENSSCWIRVAQSWASTSWGSIFIPRVGTEVVVEFLEGNPDYPIVTGSVYNANQTVPYTLPDNKTRSTLKTNSSTGGSGYNELRFEDKAGSEEVYFQAQKDYNMVIVQGNSTVTVQQGNHSHTVSKGNNTTTISQGNNSTTVSQGNESLTVSAGQPFDRRHRRVQHVQRRTVDHHQGESVDHLAGRLEQHHHQHHRDQHQRRTISASATGSMSLDGGPEMTLTGGMIAIN